MHKHGETEAKNKKKTVLICSTYVYAYIVRNSVRSYFSTVAWKSFWDKLRAKVSPSDTSNDKQWKKWLAKSGTIGKYRNFGNDIDIRSIPADQWVWVYISYGVWVQG